MEKLKGKKPSIRFPEFKDDWQQKNFGDIFSFRVTNSFSRDKLNYSSGKVKNIHYGDIHTKFSTLFDITKERVPFINMEVELKRIDEENYCKVGDLVITDASEDYNGVGKSIEIVNLNNEKVLAGLHTILARPDKAKVGLGFFGYYFLNEGFRTRIKKIAQGSKVLSISSKRLAEIEIVIPPSIPEQKRIASFFTVVDKKMAELKQKKALLEQYKNGVMQKLFSQELRFKDDNGKEFPKWEKKKLGEIFRIKSEKYNPVKETYSVKCIELEHLATDTGKLLGYVEGSDLNSIKNKFKNGDVLFGKLRPYLRKFLRPNFDGVCSSEIWVLEGLTISNHFLYWLIQTVSFIEIANKSSGSKMPRADWSLISSQNFKFPTSKTEQTKIANFLSAIDDKINRTENQLLQTQQWKKGLLQSMFV